MHDVGVAVRLVLVLLSFPLVVWLGVALTREGRPLAGVVERHFRVLVVGLLVAKICLRLLENDGNARVVRGMEMGIVYAFAALVGVGVRRVGRKVVRVGDEGMGAAK